MDESRSRWDPVPFRVCLQITAARDSRGEQSTPTHVGAERTRKLIFIDFNTLFVSFGGGIDS